MCCAERSQVPVVEVNTQDSEAVARLISFSSMKENSMTNFAYTKYIKDYISPLLRNGNTGIG